MGKQVGIERIKTIDLQKNQDNIYAFLDLKEFTTDCNRKLSKTNKSLENNIEKTRKEVLNKSTYDFKKFLEKHLIVKDVIGKGALFGTLPEYILHTRE